MSFFKGKDFTSCKKMTDPVYAAGNAGYRKGV